MNKLIKTTYCMWTLLHREFKVCPNLHEEAKAPLPQLPLGVMFQLCSPEGDLAPEDCAMQRLEFELFDVEEAELDSDNPDGIFSKL